MGGISATPIRKSIRYENVFQYHATPSQIAVIQQKIVGLANQCITRRGVDAAFPYINDVTTKLDNKYRKDFTTVLYYGSFTPRYDKRKSPGSWTGTIADILAWNWSETSGKFIGCTFWSLAAKEMFDREISKKRSPSLEDAWRLAKCLQRRRLDGQPRDKTVQLTHEHVFPKKFLCKKLLELQNGICDIDKLRSVFSRLAVGCVVLQSEHPPDRWADCDNPWRRYRQQGITLVENSAWPPEHRHLIKAAGVHVVS
jgi:hypothetical protein